MQNYIQKLIFILFIVFFAQSSVYSQDYNDITYEDSYYKFGVYGSGNGWGIFFRNMKVQNSKFNKTFEINAGSLKHFKERNILNQRIGNATPYVFGKINRLYALRPMFGYSVTLAEKVSKSSVGVEVFGGFGPIIGFLKPVYVDIDQYDSLNSNNYYTISAKYNPKEMNQAAIIGYSSFGKGINETKLLAGIAFKAGCSFNWGHYRSDFKSIELGVMIDYFPSTPPLMVYTKNKTIFSSFYISFALGKNY
jgi:hypothetical protein